MTFVTFLVAVVCVLLFANTAYCEDRAVIPPIEPYDPYLLAPMLPELVLEPCPGADEVGVEGDAVMFQRDTAECMLMRLELLAELAPYVRLLENRMNLVNDRDALQLRRVDLAEAEARSASGALDEAMTRAIVAEEERDAWYRSPILWVSVGVVITVALEAVAVLILREVSE